MRDSITFGYVLHYMPRNYDAIAWFYDRLARVIFGRVLINAQLFLLRAIIPGSDMLIVGGGTGWILEEITKRHSSGLNITYIDASPKMIELARKRDVGANKVAFIAAPIEQALLAGPYDIVITPFFFDNFNDNTMRHIFTAIDSRLGVDGAWLYCDFRNTEVLWQKMLLRVMYLFFRVTCGVEATMLPDAEGCFRDAGYRGDGRALFAHGFIVSEIYRRANQ